jgi:hypothetical protein
VVLDEHHRVSRVHQFPERSQQSLDVGQVQQRLEGDAPPSADDGQGRGDRAVGQAVARGTAGRPVESTT